ncbi:MAG: B12-binding domain-containing radical SAM protein [Planctomycetes bacterium]|nr:B12-binding domain-containing radical SAM protein [Planctomycetota bacterium]
MADIVLVNPRFEPSYWGLEHALPLFGKKANLPVACLPLLAALTPREHCVALVDESIQPLDWDRLARADLVGVTGMSVQRFRMKEILAELKARGAFTVVGGPWVTVEEDYFGELADVIFIGEAEETWPRFLRQWTAGAHQRRYEQSERSDMTQVPCPRYDLLRSRDYMFGSVQFSRGCPFQCEFCDIIVTFGRRPRLKTRAQVLAEIQALHRQGLDLTFIVDDNLIGNKHAVKDLLRALAGWQEENGYPMTFFTEASLDLCEDDELIDLMVRANIQSVFIGIESPNEESLRETKKLQNVRRRGGTMLDKIHKIQRLGLEVWCGMIVGFDHDDPGVFDAQVRFIQEARIVHAMVGMLAAIPKTPLHSRLAREGRLDFSDRPEFGTNVIPLRMGRDELADGYRRVMRELYQPHAYFDRVDRLFLDPRFQVGAAQRAHWRKRFWPRVKAQAANMIRALAIQRRLMRTVKEGSLRQEYRRRLRAVWRSKRDPYLLFVYAVKCVMHYHYYTMVRDMARERRTLVNTF